MLLNGIKNIKAANRKESLLSVLQFRSFIAVSL
jgi:hypothetical protein